MSALDFLGLAIRLGPLVPKVQKLASDVKPLAQLVRQLWPTIQPQIEELWNHPDVVALRQRLALDNEIVVGQYNVEWLQQSLKDLGVYQLEVDGEMGPKTIEAVKRFQKLNGLEPDGWAGPITSVAISIAKANKGLPGP
jgi:murein L,D-transpeptidase YcbB/YkuD